MCGGKSIFGSVLAVILTFNVHTANAENVELDKVCDRLRSCALEEMSNVNASEFIQELALNLVEQQCYSILQPDADTVNQASLGAQANACLDSIESLSCDDLKRAKEIEATPQCEKFQASADAAGIDTSGSQLESLKQVVN